MSIYSDMDARAAEAIGRLMGDPIDWHPMATRQASRMVVGPAVPDPDRAIRLGLVGIVSWAPDGLAVDSGQGGSSVGNAKLLVDVEVRQFRGEFEAAGTPRKGDRFYLPNESAADRWVQIARSGDDGSARLFFWCELVRAGT